MRCGRAQRLIHLYRAGECTAAERIRLLRHLDRCASCRALADRSETVLDAGRADLSVPPDAAGSVVEAVMLRVEAMEREGEGKSRSLGTGWGLQPVIAMLVLLLAGGLLLQEASVMRSMERLARRLEEAGTVPSGAEWRLERVLEGVGSARGPLGAALEPGRFVLVRRSDLLDLLQEVVVGPVPREELERRLVLLLPQLAGIGADAPLTRAQMRTLLDRREEIRRMLRGS